MTIYVYYYLRVLCVKLCFLLCFSYVPYLQPTQSPLLIVIISLFMIVIISFRYS